jgi:hypothetical protein
MLFLPKEEQPKYREFIDIGSLRKHIARNEINQVCSALTYCQLLSYATDILSSVAAGYGPFVQDIVAIPLSAMSAATAWMESKNAVESREPHKSNNFILAAVNSFLFYSTVVSAFHHFQNPDTVFMGAGEIPTLFTTLIPILVAGKNLYDGFTSRTDVSDHFRSQLHGMRRPLNRLSGTYEALGAGAFLALKTSCDILSSAIYSGTIYPGQIFEAAFTTLGYATLVNEAINSSVLSNPSLFTNILSLVAYVGLSIHYLSNLTYSLGGQGFLTQTDILYPVLALIPFLAAVRNFIGRDYRV